MKIICRILAFFSATLLLSHCGYNSLQGLDEDTKAAWAEVQNQYMRRADLIPNLVEIVRGYAKHEKETLEAVIKARSEATQIKLSAANLSEAGAVSKFQAAQDGLSSTLSRLMFVAEKYPDLKADAGFRDLQAQLEGTENRITVARNRYIEAVATFNKGVRSFPTNLTAKYLLDLKVKDTFTAPEAAQTAPQVKF